MTAQNGYRTSCDIVCSKCKEKKHPKAMTTKWAMRRLFTRKDHKIIKKATGGGGLGGWQN